MHQLIWIIPIAIVLAVISPLLEARRRSAPPVRAKQFMTDRETKFWRMLRVAADPLHVAPQVALGALLTTEQGIVPKLARQTRNRFSQKIVDFVLVDETGSVRLIVELDDRTHVPAKDEARDAMTRRAGYVTVRVNGVVARDPALLKARVDEALGLPPSWSPPTFDPARLPAAAQGTSARANGPRA